MTTLVPTFLGGTGVDATSDTVEFTNGLKINFLHVEQTAGTLPGSSTNGIVVQKNASTSDIAVISLIGGASADSRVEFGDAGDRDIGMIRYTHSDNAMEFYTNTSEQMTITSAGIVVIGHTASVITSSALQASLQIMGTAYNDSSISAMRWSADANGATINLGKSRNGTIGSNTVVSDGDELGKIDFSGDDGTDYQTLSGRISSVVNGTPGTGDIPADLVFSSGDGGSVAEVLRLAGTGLAASFTGDVNLKHDGAVLYFGADNDVSLTHVADTGLLLNSTREIQFRDSALKIYSSADGQLDLAADTEIELTAATVAVEGIFNVSSTSWLYDDVQFRHDGVVLNFGDGNDVTATHVHDVGLDFASTRSGADSIFRFKNSANASASDIRLIIQNGGTSGGDPIINLDGQATNATWTVGVDTSATKFVIADADKGGFDGNDEVFTIATGGDATFAGATQHNSTVTVGVDDTGYDVKFFGATSGRYLLWDESADTLIFTDNTRAYFGSPGNDLQIYHDGSNSYINEAGTGDLNVTVNSNFVVDAVGDIILDADGGDINFKDGGTEIGRFTNSSSDFAIHSIVQDKDILFKGNDGGAAVTALQLDMSAGGTATFSDDVKLAHDGAVLYFGADSEVNITHVHDTGLTTNKNLTIGPGGTGTDRIKVTADGGTGDGAGALFEVRQNGAYIGGFGNEAALDGSGTGSNLEIRAASGKAIVLAPNNTDTFTLTSGGDATLDVATDIILDAGGGDIYFKDDGATIGSLNNSASNFRLVAHTDNKDIIFRGGDNGTWRDVLTLDMSDAGTAIFYHDVNATSAGSKFIFGHSSYLNTGTTDYPQIHYSDKGNTLLLGEWSSTNASEPTLRFLKSASSTIGTNTLVADDENLGAIAFNAADGTDLLSIAAKITAYVDGTPGASDMPGRLEFATSSDGADSPTTALTLDASQNATFANDIKMSSASGTINFTDTSKGIYYDGNELVMFTTGADDYITLNGETYIKFAVNSDEKVRILSTGAVGINQSNPQNLLHITDTASGSLTKPIRLHNNATGTSTKIGIEFTNSTDATSAPNSAQIYTERTASSENAIVLAPSNGTVPTEALRLATGGNATFAGPVTTTSSITGGSASVVQKAGLAPVGSIIAYGSTTVPTGWLACDDSAVSRTTYSVLFAVLGTSYGTGNGSTTFNVPDLRDRMVMGKGTNNSTMGASSTGASGSFVVASASGSASLTTSSGTFATSAKDSSTSSALTGVTAGGHTHNVTMPAQVCMYIIKA